MYLCIYRDLVANGPVGFDVQFGEFHRSSNLWIPGVGVVVEVAVIVGGSFWHS